jgi:hypothetical protein
MATEYDDIFGDLIFEILAVRNTYFLRFQISGFLFRDFRSSEFYLSRFLFRDYCFRAFYSNAIYIY